MTRQLNEKQHAAIALLAIPKRGGLTYEEVAERVGTSRVSLHAWRKLPTFNTELKRQIVSNTIDDLPEIMASFKDHIVKDGNAALARVFMQAHDMLTDKLEVDNKGGSGSSADTIDAMKAKIEQMRSNKE